MISILCGPNNGAVYRNGNFEISHMSLQRGCTTEDIAKILEESLESVKDGVKEGQITIYEVTVGDEPYLKDHGEFPQNSKLLVRNYWKRRGYDE